MLKSNLPTLGDGYRRCMLFDSFTIYIIESEIVDKIWGYT